MRETLLVVAMVAVLALISYIPPQAGLRFGAWLTGLSLLFGIPTGLKYHVELARALRPRGQLPRRWWVSPIALHDRLAPGERPRVLGWCYAGALGFAGAMLGCAAVITALLRFL